ncbi:MAG: crossover junction endodeoxyribonuclease RuvC [Firmicutes bacterium]|nr:crossover junction endodeoxyribonuclease RuvC [Bacillota bacterium]
MRIMGIDPGTAITGFGLLEQEGSRLRLLEFGVIRTEPEVPDAERLLQIHREVGALLKNYRPDEIAIEELFFNKNSRSVLAVGQARGVVMLAAAQADLRVEEYTPLQVKMAVVGYGRAEKRQVQEMVKVLLGLARPPKPDDAADALAVAICHAHSRLKYNPHACRMRE